MKTKIGPIFLAIAWEYFGKPGFNLKLWVRSFLTLLGVMWIDVILFAFRSKNPSRPPADLFGVQKNKG